MNNITLTKKNKINQPKQHKLNSILFENSQLLILFSIQANARNFES